MDMSLILINDVIVAELPERVETWPLRGTTRNHALCCGKCGSIWARILNDPELLWQFSNAACARHGGGSLLMTFPDLEKQFDRLPRPVLEYEFMIQSDPQFAEVTFLAAS